MRDGFSFINFNIMENYIQWLNDNHIIVDRVFYFTMGNIIYSEVWSRMKKRFSNYKTRRYQNVLEKRRCDILPS